MPFFFSAPATAMALSAEKFTYTNKLMGDFYSSDEMIDVAMHAGMKESDLMKAELHMLTKVAKAPAEAGLVSA